MALGRTSLAVPMDLMDRSSVENVAAVALADMGRVDVLVNNAIYQGPGTMDRILDLPLELAERCLVGDYLHPLLLTQLLLPGMLERGEGRLVNMLSEAAFTTPPAPAGAGGWGVAYAAAKAAFHRVTDMCHVEFAAQGISAFSIAPGLTLTESMRASGMDEVLVGAGHVPPRPRWPARWPPGWVTIPTPCGTPARWCRHASCARSCRSCPAGRPPRPHLARDGARQPHRIGEGHQTRGGHVGGAGAEHAVQLFEGLIAEGGVGGLGQLVGQLLDPAVQGASGVGDACPSACKQTRGRQRRRRTVPFRPRSSRGCPAAARPGWPWSRPPARAPAGR